MFSGASLEVGQESSEYVARSSEECSPRSGDIRRLFSISSSSSPSLSSEGGGGGVGSFRFPLVKDLVLPVVALGRGAVVLDADVEDFVDLPLFFALVSLGLLAASFFTLGCLCRVCFPGLVLAGVGVASPSSDSDSDLVDALKGNEWTVAVSSMPKSQ